MVIWIGPEVLLLAFASPVAVISAVFWIDGQLAVVVVAVNVMVFVVPLAIVPKLHVSVVPPATGEAGEQEAASAPATVHVSPVGRTSVSTTFVELPVPPAVTVME